MKPSPLKSPYLLLASAGLCGLGLLAAAGRHADTNAEGGLVPAVADTPMIQADDATAVTPRHLLRRRHGVLSMPYFSFARSLRPGN
ncbi:hypothetical protein GCM10027084_15930 [Pseudoxanthomonas sangjuensis]|uniref:hypothetical protein n=1 Tax=Pseudoxanthomonas sangjuensis TaxID=1503750 RepID=UPI00139103C2|nr:hypothetical protein [Pseudoxanthomonas sangjuensis]KAF1707899.1 hypothetical protein CSC71_12310 [Pseudoxanthomonas sangjuensis]